MTEKNPATIAEIATDVKWLRGWAADHDKKHERIDDKQDRHGEQISALSARQKMILAVGSPVLIALLVAVVKLAVAV